MLVMAIAMGHLFISYSHKDKDYVQKLQEALQNEGFEVYFHKQVPTNDGGLALGQAAIANYQIKNGGLHVP